jgi:hypothetical protein
VHPPLPYAAAAAAVGKKAVDEYYRDECQAALERGFEGFALTA